MTFDGALFEMRRGCMIINLVSPGRAARDGCATYLRCDDLPKARGQYPGNPFTLPLLDVSGDR